MAKGLMKKVAERKRKLKGPQNIALEAENQAEFDEKVSEIKSQIEEGTRKIPGYSGTPGVVYVGSIPRGFHEHQMTKFFSQFGKVLKLRLSRSKKTGNPKGYAFVMFEYDEVAKVVADTMNNYLMFQKLMKCRHVPAQEVHKDLFKGWDRKFTRPKAHLLSMDRHNAPKTDAQKTALARRARRKVQKKINKLAALGIDYSMPVEGTMITAKRSNTESTVENEEPELSTPARQVLLDDSSDDEISMKTPPGSVRVKKAKAKVTPKTKASSKTKATALVNNKNVKSLKAKGRLGALGATGNKKGKKK